MSRLNNAMEIFKILKKTNCGECRVPTCLAFAAAVFNGQKRLQDCPHMEPGLLDRFEVNNADSRTLERELEKLLEQLQDRVAAVDLAGAAQTLGASYGDDKVTIKVLGKDFSVNSRGQVTSDCHVHGWVTVPLLNYVLTCKGTSPSGNWVPFRELENGATWSGLFAQRCEKPLKQVADTHTDLFELMIQVFSAKRAPDAFDSDIAVVLHPLPGIPMLICYWKPDGDLESSLHVFFDDTAEDHLDADSLYRLAAGLVLMFEKIALTHGI